MAHPPRSNPPLRSSSGPPSPCITPSTETFVLIVSFMVAVPFSLVWSSFGMTGPPRRRLCGLGVGGLLYVRLDLFRGFSFGLEHRRGDGDSDDDEAGPDKEGQLVPARERGDVALSGPDQSLAARGGEGGERGEPHGGADLHGRVDEAGGEAGVFLRRAGHRQDRERRE